MLEFLSFTSYSHFFFVVKLAYTTILQRTHQQPSRDDMVQFYCEHHNLDHGDFCSENYNIAGTPNLNSKSNSNSNLKVAVNLYVFFVVFFQRVEITKVPWIELYNNMSKGSKFQDSKIGPKKGQKKAKKCPKKGPRKGQNKPGGTRSSQEEPGGARRSREEP